MTSSHEEGLNGGAESPKRTFDSFLTRFGDFGKYQTIVFILLGLPAISCAMHALAWVFLGAKISHRCQLAGEDNDALYHVLPNGTSFATSFPQDFSTDYNISSCYKYDEKGLETHCDGKYVYDRLKYQSSARIDFELICERKYLYTVAETMFKGGILIGAFVFGDLSDRYGRRPVFFGALVLQVSFGVMAGIAPNYWIFVFSRVVIGAAQSGIFTVAFVIALELVGTSKRVAAGMGIQTFFTVGYAVVGLLAYLIRDWHVLQLTLSLPGVFFLSYYWIMPESLRWLWAKGRKEEVIRILSKVGRINKVAIDFAALDVIEKEHKPKSSSIGIFQIFSYPRVALRSFNIFFCWFVNAGVYYGLALNSGNLGGNDYINFALSGLVEIPAYLFLLLTLNRFGRKFILCGTLLASGFFLVACAFTPKDLLWLLITLNMLGKMCNAASYAAIYLFAAELFPTVIRSGGMGVSSVCARIGSISSDYVILLGEAWSPLPHLIFGSVCLISGMLSLFLPETLNKNLPETMEDGENFGLSKKEEESKTSEEMQEMFPNKE